MPIYEYKCEKCNTVFEEWQSGFEEREMKCPECGASAKRMISNTSFVLKGTGWYVTDYAGKNPSTNSSDGNGGDSGSGAESSEAASAASTASADSAGTTDSAS